MTQLFLKPYLVTAALIPVVLVLGFIQFDKVISLNIYDTYYIARRMHLSVFISVMLLIFSVLLFFYDRFSVLVNQTIVWIYCAVTLVAVLVLYIAPTFEITTLANNRDELLHKSAVSNRVGVVVFFSCAAFAVAQFCFAVLLLFWTLRKIFKL